MKITGKECYLGILGRWNTGQMYKVILWIKQWNEEYVVDNPGRWTSIRTTDKSLKSSFIFNIKGNTKVLVY